MGVGEAFEGFFLAGAGCLVLEELVDDEGDGTVTGHITSRAKTVHSNIKGNHECLLFGIKAQYALQNAQCRHDGSTRNTRSCHHHDAKHENESCEHTYVEGHALHEHERHSAGSDFHGAAREVNGGAQGHHKARNAAGDTILLATAERDGNGGGARRGAECGEVGGQHFPEQFQGIALGDGPGDAVLCQQQHYMHGKDDAYDGDECHCDFVGLSVVAHHQEDAKDVEGQQRDDGHRNGLGNDFLELVGHILERLHAQVSDAQSHHESEDERRHHIEDGGYVDGEEGFHILDGLDRGNGVGRSDERGENRRTGEVGEEPRQHRIAIGYDDRDEQQLAGALANVGNGRRDESHNDERDEEGEEIAEDAVEGGENAHCPHGEELSESDAQDNGDEDAWQQRYFDLFHRGRDLGGNALIFEFVGFGDGADYAAGVACGEYARWDVMHHDAAAGDNRVVADGHTRHHAHIAAKPHIVAHGNGQGVLEPVVALLGIERVSGGVEGAVRGDEHMVAKGDARLVENDQIGVGKEVFAHLDVETVVAEERRGYLEALAGLAQNLLEERFAFLGLVRPQLVVVVAFL